jgi:hypothetical protein
MLPDGSPLKVGMHIWEEKIGVNYRFLSGELKTAISKNPGVGPGVFAL